MTVIFKLYAWLDIFWWNKRSWLVLDSSTNSNKGFLSFFFWSQDLNIGGSTVSAAIVEATGTQKSKIKEMYNSMGDLGMLETSQQLY